MFAQKFDKIFTQGEKMILLFFVFFMAMPSAFLQADFFAYRKLTDPKTENNVYLLYDIHATVDFKPETTKILEKQLNEAGKKFLKEEHSAPSAFAKKEQKTFSLIRENFVNLLKQQQDLASAIKTYNISIINEDWIKTKPSNFETIGKESRFARIINKYIGNPVNAHNLYYREFITPMSGLGEILTGHYKQLEFQKITNTNAYYYNADQRTESWACKKEEKCKEVNDYTIIALEKLFTDYKQSKVIICEGYAHIVAIAHELVTQKGFQQSDLIISDALKKQRNNIKNIDQLLSAFENNDSKEEDSIELTNEEIYYLINDPINIKAIFEEEFKNLKPSLDLDRFARSLQSIA